MVFSAIHAAADRNVAIIVQYQVWMSPRLAEPALDLPLRLCDRRTDDMFGGGAVCIGRSAGDVTFPLEALAQLLLGLSHMLAQNMSAMGLVPAEIAHRTIRRVGLNPGLRRTRNRTRR